MIDRVYLLWLVREVPPGAEDVELLIGVYSSEMEAKAARERVKNKRGFVDFQDGFQVHPYRLNHDAWTEGFAVDNPSD